ncbi:short-chain dehydrogenase/reductase (SDR) superfamily [Halorhodospira halochloris]|uniref:Short-chain dehydrogenase/reductase (SDR) superfamily n=1 Tax=Halorhodospira halochloris TaxID=1052 RepID=A0A110B5W9_HALHR|nr:SDR family oxidoreductase [Halorhodospira halochloris]MBK1652577.1 short-chain dehydrogenase [Halorhodospira halochloris]MCG5548660.1 SDR family oxidoreductase [Halorhodospira halochloris]BAU58167.1 short-chain dehydrogenase/reductase (SDR) superfamily [Halorhodospira halochloris]
MSKLIIGASRGIGLEVVKQLRERGDEVLATVRSTPPSELHSCAAKVFEGVDITAHDTLRELASKIGSQELEWVLVVSGLMRVQHLGRLDEDAVKGIREQFEINSLGPLMAAEFLSPLIGNGGKFGIVTSRMGSIADNTSGNSYGYRMSKAAVNMAAVSLAHDLQPKGISVALLHPGWVRTDMTGHNGLIDPPESAAALIERMDNIGPEESGCFWHAPNREILPW